LKPRLPYLAGLAALAVMLGALAEAGLSIGPPSLVPLPQADAIVLLGGGWEYREKRVVELLRLGLARRILLTGVGEWSGVATPANYPSYDYLRAAGVAAEAVLADGSARNTWQEIIWVRNIAKQNGWQTLLVVSDPPHLHRLAWVCRQVLDQHGIAYRLVPSNPDWWQPASWWRNSSALRYMALECLKLNYYRVRYGWARP